MPTLNLKNITIKKLQDKNLQDYYLIIDQNDNDKAYFCFPKTLQSGWDNLVNNYQNITEVELEYETNDRGNNKVTNLFTNSGDEVFV
jgi:hypothetical protein